MKKKDYDSITAAEAARMLNVPAQMVREHLKRGKGIFSGLGEAEKNGSKYTYIILRGRVEKFIEENY
ncbi:MAG: hypothetical protein J6B63_02435 [Treponema sp.]|nr:hypothetical protein [Treponema sp.]